MILAGKLSKGIQWQRILYNAAPPSHTWRQLSYQRKLAHRWQSETEGKLSKAWHPLWDDTYKWQFINYLLHAKINLRLKFSYAEIVSFGKILSFWKELKNWCLIAETTIFHSGYLFFIFKAIFSDDVCFSKMASWLF